MEIKFSVGPSPLGTVLVAATKKGVCAVSLRESDAGAEESLRARFPMAELKRDDATLEPTLDAVRNRIAGRQLDREVPLDLQGTDFQRAVWDQLLSIPPGKTRSYLDVAQAINRPKATRAVARACGSARRTGVRRSSAFRHFSLQYHLFSSIDLSSVDVIVSSVEVILRREECLIGH